MNSCKELDSWEQGGIETLVSEHYSGYIGEYSWYVTVVKDSRFDEPVEDISCESREEAVRVFQQTVERYRREVAK